MYDMNQRIPYFLLGVILVFFALFCLYGMLHSREPGNSFAWFLGYAVAFLNASIFSFICLRKAFMRW